MDFARSTLSVIAVGYIDSSTLCRVPLMIELRNVPFDQQEQLKAGRYPHLVSNVRESADMEKFSTALERLQRSGLKVKTSWVYDQLNIPQPGENDDVLEPNDSAALAGEGLDQLDILTANLDKQTEPAFDGMLQPVRDALESAESLQEFAEAIAGLSAELDDVTLIEQVQKATAVATLAGMYDEAQRG